MINLYNYDQGFKFLIITKKTVKNSKTMILESVITSSCREEYVKPAVKIVLYYHIFGQKETCTHLRTTIIALEYKGKLGVAS